MRTIIFSGFQTHRAHGARYRGCLGIVVNQGKAIEFNSPVSHPTLRRHFRALPPPQQTENVARNRKSHREVLRHAYKNAFESRAIAMRLIHRKVGEVVHIDPATDTILPSGKHCSLGPIIVRILKAVDGQACLGIETDGHLWIPQSDAQEWES